MVVRYCSPFPGTPVFSRKSARFKHKPLEFIIRIVVSSAAIDLNEDMKKLKGSLALHMKPLGQFLLEASGVYEVSMGPDTRYHMNGVLLGPIRGPSILLMNAHTGSRYPGGGVE